MVAAEIIFRKKRCKRFRYDFRALRFICAIISIKKERNKMTKRKELELKIAELKDALDVIPNYELHIVSDILEVALKNAERELESLPGEVESVFETLMKFNFRVIVKVQDDKFVPSEKMDWLNTDFYDRFLADHLLDAVGDEMRILNFDEFEVQVIVE